MGASRHQQLIQLTLDPMQPIASIEPVHALPSGPLAKGVNPAPPMHIVFVGPVPGNFSPSGPLQDLI